MSYGKPVRVWCVCGASAEREVDEEQPFGWHRPLVGVFACCSRACYVARHADLHRGFGGCDDRCWSEDEPAEMGP